jgi:TonB family protein
MKWMTIFAAALSMMLTASAAEPPEHPQVIRMEHMPEAKILHKVMPMYPPDAADMHINGMVKIGVMIAKDGHIERTRLISGHPLLAPAAMQAARQWKFEPTSVNGYPVHVISEIDIPFNLDAHGLPIAPSSQMRPGSAN